MKMEASAFKLELPDLMPEAPASMLEALASMPELPALPLGSRSFQIRQTEASGFAKLELPV